MNRYRILQAVTTLYVALLSVNATKFTRVTHQTGWKYGSVLENATLSSLIGCATFCDTLDTCLAINYDEETSSCELVENMEDPMVNKAGWISYKKFIPKFSWSICTGNGQCNNNGCSETGCDCLPSYRYNWRSGTCVQECADGYGDTYIEHLNKRLAVAPFFSKSGTTLEECSAFCKNTTISVCQGFNHNKNNGNCNIKLKEPLTEADFVGHVGMSYYTRNCN